MDWIAAAGFFGVIACWMGFAAVFQFRRKPPKEAETKRDSASYWGIGLESAGMALVWCIPRPYFSPFVRMSKSAEAAVSSIAVIIALASVWPRGATVRTLGKQWTYRARVIEGHELITRGPYSLVRNPIYLGMFGMLVATGLVVGRWWTLLAAAIIFLSGTVIRIKAEEKLLRETFGDAFEGYANRVPAFFPRVF
jgi:protein-S-isoprenylcysteine O-methyltransferase Ste14